ncbi:PaaI family thioesterase [Pararhodobacter zhoushanensis]|uniref:PaaI family thioesterase n=1 Tax=Pararhodobacter zhoushanensis TaxID=2479545 RepID=A0ABT3H5G7_9RHOB|nr:PaaI family thioesterase [Pararhodobacter zhoushanensis]MCW1935034.1 PaaI family thioesterase [Pararhodobacter zhoushanensis]
MPDDLSPYPSSARGFMGLIGARKTGYSDGYARFELDIGPHLLNPMGIPHGGVYASILDTTLGSSGCWEGNPDTFRPSVTLNLNVSYLAQPRGTRLICEARRVGGGKSIYFSEGEIHDETGVLVARASGTFKIITRR